MKTRLLLCVLSLTFTNAFAQDLPWRVSGGLDYRSSKFTLPAAAYSSHDWTASTSLARALDPLTAVGGVFSYTKMSNSYSGSGADTGVTSVGAFGVRQLSPGLYADAYLGYGNSAIDYRTNNVSFRTKGNSTIVAAGLAQTIPITNALFGGVNARLTHIYSKGDSVTAFGVTTPASSTTLNYLTLGGRLDYVIGDLRPNMSLNWNKANSEFQTGTGDKDYFNYAVGLDVKLTPQTNVAVSLRSIFGKAYAEEFSVGLNLNHRF